METGPAVIFRSLYRYLSPPPAVLLLPILVVLLLTWSCSAEGPAAAVDLPLRQCTSCHHLELDKNHQLACISCHQGHDPAADKESAHAGLIARPAEPQRMAQTCGSCHPAETSTSQHSLHFSQANLINLVRGAFGAGEQLKDLTEIPVQEPPTTLPALADDMLRRRCLRCHLYAPGDAYPATQHGTGCAACHLAVADGKLTSHVFLAEPDDSRCLSCHYGNRVGFDYYGRFEHDFNGEYRTPFPNQQPQSRPYGLEYHQLRADIHRQRGLICIDCHRGSELMGDDRQGPRLPSCAGCHDQSRLAVTLPAAVSREGDTFLFTARSGKKVPLPLLRNPAHQRYGKTVTCQVCHAGWSFIDDGSHLLRADDDDYDQWEQLVTQGSAELEKLLLTNLDPDQDEVAPSMSDTISGTSRPGVWHLGYGQRRWEWPLLGRDENGVLQVVRPILDLSLSWLDSEGKVRFDSEKAEAPQGGRLPYTPHTTGPAGLFYEERIRAFLEAEHAASPTTN